MMKITYIHHSSFLVELDCSYLLFDYTEGIIPELNPDKPLYVFASHRHGDHYSAVIFNLMQKRENIRYILSNDIWRKRLPEEAFPITISMKHYANAEVSCGPEGGSVKITTFKSTDEGVAFLVEAEGKRIYHAGDLNNWTWDGEPDGWNTSMAKKYSAQLEKMAGVQLDVAFLPLDPRQEEYFYLGMDEFLTKISVGTVFPMHCWGDFSVIAKIKAMERSAAYREKIEDISRDGEVFFVAMNRKSGVNE